MDLKPTHIRYIENTLVANILRDERFCDHTLKSCVVFTGASKLDGFMSSIYQVELQLINKRDERHIIIIKI